MSSSSTTGVARSSLYRPYHRSNSTSSSSSSIENLPPRTLSRVTKEVRELIKNPPEGVRLVVDNETGLPSSLGEIVVRRTWCYHEIRNVYITSFIVTLEPNFCDFAAHANRLKNPNDHFKIQPYYLCDVDRKSFHWA
jgi:hypothetical protein